MTLVPLLAALPRVDGIGFGANTTQVGMSAPAARRGRSAGRPAHRLSGSQHRFPRHRPPRDAHPHPGLVQPVLLHTQKWHVVLAVSLSGVGIYLALTALINLITNSVEEQGRRVRRGAAVDRPEHRRKSSVPRSAPASWPRRRLHTTGMPLGLGFTLSFGIAAVVGLCSLWPCLRSKDSARWTAAPGRSPPGEAVAANVRRPTASIAPGTAALAPACEATPEAPRLPVRRRHPPDRQKVGGRRSNGLIHCGPGVSFRTQLMSPKTRGQKWK